VLLALHGVLMWTANEAWLPLPELAAARERTVEMDGWPATSQRVVLESQRGSAGRVIACCSRYRLECRLRGLSGRTGTAMRRWATSEVCSDAPCMW
jgi:hypothetical protein